MLLHERLLVDNGLMYEYKYLPSATLVSLKSLSPAQELPVRFGSLTLNHSELQQLFNKYLQRFVEHYEIEQPGPLYILRSPELLIWDVKRRLVIENYLVSSLLDDEQYIVVCSA